MNIIINKRNVIMLISVTLIILLLFAFISITLASGPEPDYIIYLNGTENEIIKNGDLFGNELWYPGKNKFGIIRIINNTGEPIVINNIGIIADIIESKEEFKYQDVKDSFLKNMYFTLDIMSMGIFKQTIVKNTSFEEMFYDENEGTLKGLELSEDDLFTVYENKDLKYTIRMADESGDELQKIKAAIELVIGIQQH